MRLVLIEWIDPFSSGGWLDRETAVEEAKARDRLCKTVGWLLYEDAELVVVAGSVGVMDVDQIGDVFEIPRRVINRIVDLREAHEADTGDPPRERPHLVPVPGLRED